MPLDTYMYLADRAIFMHQAGIEEVNTFAKTPLMLVKFMSDIDPTQILFAYKLYKKSKKILRNEIILGNELKAASPTGSGTLSDFFFNNAAEAKKYVFFCFVLEYLRQTEGLNEEQYQHGYHRFVKMDWESEEHKKRYLQTLLINSKIQKEFQDVEFFDVFADQIFVVGFVDRRFFSNLTDMQYRRIVRESGVFERKCRGEYRPRENSHLFKVLCDYKNHRTMLNEIQRQKALDGFIHSDTGIKSG